MLEAAEAAAEGVAAAAQESQAVAEEEGQGLAGVACPKARGTSRYNLPTAR